MANANDWNLVRRELDKVNNFEAICNSPWCSDAFYNKFSNEEFARRNASARQLIIAIGLKAE